jgi:hypothetical protein
MPVNSKRIVQWWNSFLESWDDEWRIKIQMKATAANAQEAGGLSCLGEMEQEKAKEGRRNLHKGCTGLEQLRAVECFLHHLTKRHANSAGDHPHQFFAKELLGETPPSFATMEDLYGLAAEMYALRPWHVLAEGELVLIRDSATGETCYCSVIGALGEVLAMHAYIGTESYRLFRKIAAGKIVGAGEFFETQHSVYVEFAPRADLDGKTASC